MRLLRPGRVLVLDSALWVLDAVQPVAAVLDPTTHAVLQVVSWAEVPPAPSLWSRPRVLSDDSGLWVQQHPGGPLARLGADGSRTFAWTRGLLLAVSVPGAAWCAPAPPGQQLVAGPDPHPLWSSGGMRLLRTATEGACTSVWTEQSVRAVRADADGLLVRVDGEGWTLRDLGAGTREVLRPSRWLRLPFDSPLPERLTVAEHGLPAGFTPGADAVGDLGEADDAQWVSGAPDPADLHGGDLTELRRRESAMTAASTIDITEHCWPPAPRPPDLDSYLAQVLADNSRLEAYWRSQPDTDGRSRLLPLADGMSEVRTAVAGEWPHTCLEWTFRYTGRPGVVLRRRVPLFDELGRIDAEPSEHASIELMEALDTKALPPATAAVDGVLDV